MFRGLACECRLHLRRRKTRRSCADPTRVAHLAEGGIMKRGLMAESRFTEIADLGQSILEDADLRGVWLSDVDFRGSTLSRIRFGRVEGSSSMKPY